jgi:hypothetical protein
MATNDKYDRQLRLWGAGGQRALGETTIVLINATASGTETLKNLGELSFYPLEFVCVRAWDDRRPMSRVTFPSHPSIWRARRHNTRDVEAHIHVANHFPSLL